MMTGPVWADFLALPTFLFNAVPDIIVIDMVHLLFDYYVVILIPDVRFVNVGQLL
jgi:hypothetical protein